MPLETSKQMLLEARGDGYAVCAFNIENLEMAQAVLDAAEEMEAPVILQTTPSTLRYAAPAAFAAMVGALTAQVSVPVALHLDHGDNVPLVAQALTAGFTSAMIDGSALSFDENVALTQEAVRLVGWRIPVEGELGRVGGKEDDLEAESGAYTDPEEAARFVQLTGVDSLAIGIGTSHGYYTEAPKLNFARLSEIRRMVNVPLVLHGASGLTDEDLRKCIVRGVCKVNFATELRAAYTEGVKQALRDDPELFDPKEFGVVGKRYVKEFAMTKIALCLGD